MKIVIIGAGGVAGYFGGKLTKAGYDTTFLSRGESLRIIREKGLKVKSIKEDFNVFPKVSEEASVVKTADLVVLGVKSWQIDGVAKNIKPYLKDTATILPLQNGADNADRLIKVLAPKNIIAGLCRIVSKIESPGVIHHFGYEPEIVFGEINNEKTDRIEKIKMVFDKAGFKNRISTNIQRDIWIKFLFIASISAPGALTRSVLGVMREDRFLRELLINTAKEIITVGQKLGVELHDNDLNKCFEIIDQLDFHTTMSLQRDMMQEKPSELENFNGYIVQQGDRFGIETPVNDFIYYSLRPMELKARKGM